MRRQTKEAEGQDALALLRADHRKVQQLFKEFEDIMEDEDADEEKAELVQQICMELTIHAQIEEEIFYPAVRAAIDDTDIMDEADVEHESAKHLISQLESMQPGDDHFDAKVSVLAEMVNHHIKEEQGEMFRHIRKADLDLDALGAELQERKDELMDAAGMPAPEGGRVPQKRGGAAAKGAHR